MTAQNSTAELGLVRGSEDPSGGITWSLRVRAKTSIDLVAVLAAECPAGVRIHEIKMLGRGNSESVQDVVVRGRTDRVSEFASAAAAVTGLEILEIRDLVLEAHRGGKISVVSRVPLRTLDDLETIYTPGVAQVVACIRANPNLAWDFTGMATTVGIYTNGSRVLSLGNVGPLASLPVMEGKAVLYRELVGLSGVPILVDCDDPSEFARVVAHTSKGFGAIHLEDIRSPDCFRIEEELSNRLAKPVLHDDQHGTATAVLAALINAARRIGRPLEGLKVGQIGLGAAGAGIAGLLISYGVSSVLVCDPSDYAVARLVRKGARAVDLATLMKSADLVVAATGKPGLLTPEMIRPGQVIVALANPTPEIAPEVALAAGAALAADGSSINNALAYPGLFRGALDARSRSIIPAMLIEAARVIAAHAPEESLVPSVLSIGVHRAVAEGVRRVAEDQGLCGTARP